MPIIHNSEVMNEILRSSKIQQGSDGIPRVLSSQVVPVIEVNPTLTKTAISKAVSSSNLNGSGTIYTTPNDQDFYITTVQHSYTKDATADTVGTNVKVTINGLSTVICQLSGITLTAGDKVISITFPHPIKVDRGTAIIHTAVRTAGVNNVVTVISGYLDETSNA